MYDVIIAGGGASGIMAAITAGRRNKKVLIIDQKDILGKKILVTGNGRCNITNQNQMAMFYRTIEGGSPFKVIEKFPYQSLIAFFTKLGLYSVSKNGYFYPYSGKANSVLDVLKLEIKRRNIEFVTNKKIVSAKKKNDFFIVKTTENTYKSKKLVLAMGGAAFKKMGSDGSGYKIAEMFGHSKTEIYPSLVPIVCAEKSYKKLFGIKTRASIKIYSNDEFIAENTGEVLLTKDGLSGIPSFQVSRYAAREIDMKKEVFAYIDFMPDFSDDEFFSFLENRILNDKKIKLKDFYKGLFPDKLSGLLIRISGVRDCVLVGELDSCDIKKQVRAIKHYKSRVIGTKGLDEAQVTSGGVPLKEVNLNTMESEVTDGLYLTGELLDVDGACGGYNLQWAFSSGYVAGMAL